MKQISYPEARHLMKPGDLIAFGGRGFIPATVKLLTGSPVSHIGTILQTNIPTWSDGFINQIIESTSLGSGFAGVMINRMSDHIRDYNGEIWWLPLADFVRPRFDQACFFSFLLDQVGKKYDAPQAIMSALDFIPDNRTCMDRLFCSELVTAAYIKAGILEGINPSEQTPIDVCRLYLYDGPYQLKGDLMDILPR